MSPSIDWFDIIYVMGPGGCGSDQPIGGQADTFLDFLLNEVKMWYECNLTSQTEKNNWKLFRKGVGSRC